MGQEFGEEAKGTTHPGSSSDMGRAKFGSDIHDLLAHSYSPPAPSTHAGWVWIQTARVWDPAAESFPARATEVRRFGARAKFLKRARAITTNSRSFAEVAGEKNMDCRYLGNKDG